MTMLLSLCLVACSEPEGLEPLDLNLEEALDRKIGVTATEEGVELLVPPCVPVVDAVLLVGTVSDDRVVIWELTGPHQGDGRVLEITVGAGQVAGFDVSGEWRNTDPYPPDLAVFVKVPNGLFRSAFDPAALEREDVSLAGELVPRASFADQACS